MQDFIQKYQQGNEYNMLQIAMTLATFAYDPEALLKTQLADKSLATQGDWSIVWGPCERESNRVFVAKNQQTGDICITIRGTVETAESIFIDADSLLLSPIPWQPDNRAKISDGMVDAWHHVYRMIDTNTNQSLEQFIKNYDPGKNVFVTGHSQGACLATVVSLWLEMSIPSRNIVPITFAAESAGDKAYAKLYDKTFFANNLRVFNPNDIVPMGFADLDNIKHLYHPEPPYVNCPDGFKLIVDGLMNTLPTYSQAGFAHPLTPAFIVRVEGVVHWYNRSQTFVKQIEIQHSCYTYLHLLNAPLTSGAPAVWPPDHIRAHDIHIFLDEIFK